MEYFLYNQESVNIKAVEIVFSPTGGTQKVSQIITSKWSDNRQVIDLSKPDMDFSEYIIGEEDMVLIAIPVFGARAPAIALDRLKQIQGNNAKCTLVCVYGNGDYGSTLSEMKTVADECSFQVIAAIAAIAQHSIIPEYASNRPDDEDFKQLTDFATQILDKKDIIQTRLESEPKEEVNIEEAKPKPPAEPPLPKANETCVQCGLCRQTCPVEAITSEYISDIGKCIFCMRCVRQCPHSCRKVNEDVISTAALSLKEMCSNRKENELFL